MRWIRVARKESLENTQERKYLLGLEIYCVCISILGEIKKNTIKCSIIEEQYIYRTKFVADTRRKKKTIMQRIII